MPTKHDNICNFVNEVAKDADVTLPERRIRSIAMDVEQNSDALPVFLSVIGSIPAADIYRLSSLGDDGVEKRAFYGIPEVEYEAIVALVEEGVAA